MRLQAIPDIFVGPVDCLQKMSLEGALGWNCRCLALPDTLEPGNNTTSQHGGERIKKEKQEDMKCISIGEAIEQLLGAAGMAPTQVGREDYNSGTPVITVFLPKNRDGVDFAEFKRGLREHYVIFRCSTPDGRESFEFYLNETDVMFHSVRPNKTVSVPHVAKTATT